MAGSLSSTPLLALPVTEKLSKGNIVVNAAVPPKEINVQVDGKTIEQVNSKYTTWVAKDQ